MPMSPLMAAQPEPTNMTTTEPTRNSIASLIPNKEVLKMLQSLKDSECFTIEDAVLTALEEKGVEVCY